MTVTESPVVGLPREVVPGFWWLGTCGEIGFGGKIIHSPWNAFLIRGEGRSVIIDTGAPSGWPVIRSQLARILDGAPLDYIFPTHPEMPHMGNLEALLEEYPQARVEGDLRNYHLYLPAQAARLDHRERGDELDLGDRRLVLLEAAIRDLPNTMWAYDTGSGCLFVSDGFGYSHAHQAGQCGLTDQELPEEPSVQHTAWITFNALSWAPFVDPHRYFDRLQVLLDRYHPRLIAPAHGSVITDPEAMIPIMKQGLVEARSGSLFK